MFTKHVYYFVSKHLLFSWKITKLEKALVRADTCSEVNSDFIINNVLVFIYRHTFSE